MLNAYNVSTIASLLKHVFSNGSVAGCVALAATGAGWAIAAQRVERLELAAAAMVVPAVGLEVVDRRGVRAAKPSSAVVSST